MLPQLKMPFLLIGISTFFFLGLNYIFGYVPITGDEVWGATVVNGTPLDVLVYTLRFDLHPPLYYTILDLWAVISKSDLWLKSFSILTHVLTGASVYFILRKNNIGNKLSVCCAILTLTSPMLLDYSNVLRMYSLIALLSIWFYYFTEKHTGHNEEHSIILFVLGIILANVHAIGILFVFFHFVFGAFNTYSYGNKRLFKWGLLNFIIALSAVPAVLNSLVKSATHANQPGVTEIVDTMSSMFFSQGIVNVYAAVFITIGVIGFLLYKNESRKFALVYFIFPVIIYATISYAVKPLWLERNFIFVIPLLYIALGKALNFMNEGKNKYFLYIFVFIFSLNNTLQWVEKTKQPKVENSFFQLIQILKNEQKNSKRQICVISDNPLNTFWSLLRYLDRPDWGNPLEVQQNTNEKWESLIAKIPADISESLKLTGFDNYHITDKFIISASLSLQCNGATKKPVYIVEDGSIQPPLNLQKELVATVGGYKIYKMIGL